MHHIFGKDLTYEEAEKTGRYLDRKKEEALKPLEDEIKKTPEEIKFIEKINDYLNNEFAELNIKEKFFISPEQIHFVPGTSKEKEEKIFGRTFIPGGAIHIYTSVCENRLSVYKTIVHEIIHLASAKKYYVNVAEKIVKPYRLGYGIYHHQEKEHEHFRGLTEAVTDKIILEIFRKHYEEISHELAILPAEEEKTPAPYCGEYIDILETIIKKIAEKNNEDENTVWQKFKKGLFTGEMMHLQEIEKTFGKGALRVLAALESGTKELPEQEINNKILRYFETGDENEKDKIAHEILIERERLKYRQRKNQ